MDTLKEALTEELIVGVLDRGRVPAPPAQFTGHCQHAALVDGDVVSRDVPAGRRLEHHVAGRPGDRHRRRGGHGPDHDGEHLPARLAENDGSKSHYQCVEEGACEVGAAIVTAVSNTIVSFIPVFALTDQEGKLFGPLAYTKTFAITASAILSVTVVPCSPTICSSPSSGRAARACGVRLAGGRGHDRHLVAGVPHVLPGLRKPPPLKAR